jgi:hypothetical protein
MDHRKHLRFRYHCEHCDKDYLERVEEQNLEGLDNVQRLIKRDEGHKVERDCPDCGRLGIPHDMWVARTTGVENKPKIFKTLALLVVSLGFLIGMYWWAVSSGKPWQP